MDRRASSTSSFRIGSGGAAPAVSCAACSAVLCAEIAVPPAHLFPRTGIFQCFSFIDFPTLRLLAASASRRREAGLLTRSSILSSLDAKRTNPQTPNLSTLARICLMAFQRFSFQHSWRARKKKNIKNGWRGHCRIIYTASAFLQPPSAEALRFLLYQTLSTSLNAPSGCGGGDFSRSFVCAVALVVTDISK